MSKLSRSQRKDIRYKAVRTLERADSVPPERAAEVRARAAAVLAATKPKPSLPVPPTPPSRPSRPSVTDEEPVSARAASVTEKATRAEATAAKRKRMVNRAPLVLLGLVAIAFLIVFAAQRGGKLGADDDKAKPEATSPAAAVKPNEAPRLPDDPSPPTVVTLAPSDVAAPAPPPSASAAPSTSASAAFSAAASAAFAEAASAAPSAAPKATAVPSTAPRATAEPAPVKKPVAPSEPAPVKKPAAPKKPPVSNDPY